MPGQTEGTSDIQVIPRHTHDCCSAVNDGDDGEHFPLESGFELPITVSIEPYCAVLRKDAQRPVNTDYGTERRKIRQGAAGRR